MNRYFLFSFFMAFAVVLSGCSTVANNPIPKPKERNVLSNTATGLGAGATIGGIAAHASVIGGAIGTGIGLVASTSHAAPPQLENYGVQYVNLHGRLIILIPTKSLFDINSADLKTSAYAVLEPLTNYLYNFPDANIHISGNADPIIDHQIFHEKLSYSLQQATKIAGYFWRKGINNGSTNGRLTYSSNGFNYPIATNEQLTGKMANRRIEIVVYPEGLTPYPDKVPPYTKIYTW